MRLALASKLLVRCRPSRALLGLAITAPAIAFVVGCGGSTSNPPIVTNYGGGNDGGLPNTGYDAAVAPFNGEAPHSPLPQLTYQGGALILAPKIVTITFPGDANATELQAFDDGLVTSSYWDSVRAGYCGTGSSCVGKGSSGGHVTLTAPAAASYTDAANGASGSSLQTFLSGLVGAGTLPAPDANTLYVLYFPATTTISLTPGPGQPAGTSCTQFGGYHNSVAINGITVPYAVVPECAPQSGSNMNQLQSLTFAASHEIVEAATDPVATQTTLGFYLNLNDTGVAGWNLLAGGENGDMCLDVSGLGQDQTIENGFTVQRIWNNANAAAGMDPCVPTPPNDVYFNVAPAAGKTFLILSVGQSATFEADAFSTGPTPKWTVAGIDWYSAQKQVQSPLLTFTFNGGQRTALASNGDKLQVTVTLNADPAQFGAAEGVLFSVAGPLTAPTAGHTWPIVVVTPSEADGGP